MFYCHVPKCAGVSLSRALRDQLFAASAESCFRIDLRAARQAAETFSFGMMEAREFLLAYNLSLKKNRYGSGHVFCRPRLIHRFAGEWSFVTILRNPVDRWISEYVYNKHKQSNWFKCTLDPESYLASRTAVISGRSYLRYFSSIPDNYEGDLNEFIDEAVTNLMRFSVIGTLENLDRWAEFFRERFDCRLSVRHLNASPKPEVVSAFRGSESTMKRVRELCHADLQVYERISKLTASCAAQ